MHVVPEPEHVDIVMEIDTDPAPATCPLCGHPHTVRTPLSRVERRLRRLLRDDRAAVCGAEASDIHEATSWGEPPCGCVDAFHR